MSQPEHDQKLLRDYGIAVVLAVFVALLIRGFVIEAYRIPSSAMKPTLEAGDTIFVSKSAYGIRLPQWISSDSPALTGPKVPERGDIVIFSTPDAPGRDYIKRVIGLPGDTVELKAGKLLLNGRPLATSFSGKDATCGKEILESGNTRLTHGICLEPPAMEDLPSQKIPQGSIFVIGDLRSSATEQGKTQNWRVIPVSSLKGKALYVWLSIEPSGFEHRGLFPRFRFDRMFRRIE